MEKQKQKLEFKKEIYALIIGILIGLIVGVSSTYIIMKTQENKQEEQFEQEKLTITEKLQLEITKMGLKNRTYSYVDLIETAIADYNSNKEEVEDFKKIGKSMFALDAEGNFYEIDLETNEKIENGFTITGIDFQDKSPLENTVIIVSDKGKLEEAVFLVEDNFQIKYNLIGTTVSKIGE